MNLDKLPKAPTEGPEINASEMNEDNLRMPSFGGQENLMYLTGGAANNLYMKSIQAENGLASGSESARTGAGDVHSFDQSPVNGEKGG